MKNKSLLFFFLVILVPTLWAKVIVISDLDDTLKKTKSDHLDFLESIDPRERLYPEMRRLLIDLERSYENLGEEVEFYYIDESHDLFSLGTSWIRRYEFPRGTIQTRRLLGGSPLEFKKNILSDILEKLGPRDTFYFFGDNASFDDQIYTKLADKMGLINSYIFIRDVTTEATAWQPYLPVRRVSGVNYFFSEMELINRPALFFISDSLTEDIEMAFKKRTLIPNDHYKRLKKRIESEWGCGRFDYQCREMANIEVRKLFQIYRDRF